MPICRNCKKEFSGVYRAKYCSNKCRLLYRTKINEKTGCWEWQGGKSKAGYGVLNIGGTGINQKIVTSHRLSYETFVGAISHGMFVCHKCDNPKCINPGHLFLGTQEDNAHDMAIKGRAVWAKRKMPKEVRDKISESRKKSNWEPSVEQIKKAIEGRKKKMQDPEWKKSVYDKMRGENNPNHGKMSEKYRKALQPYWDSMKGVKKPPMSEETKRKIGEANRRRHLIKIGAITE